MVRSLILNTDGDLRQPGILIVNDIPEQAGFRANDVLTECEPTAKTELGASAAGVEVQVRVGYLDTVKEADSGALFPNGEIRQRDIGEMGVGADTVARSVTRDQRPGRYPATAGTLHIGYTARREQLATFEIGEVGQSRRDGHAEPFVRPSSRTARCQPQ